MVAGHLQIKKDLYYMVLSFNDAAGKRKTKWISTGLPVKGNKKRAEAMLMDLRANYEVEPQAMEQPAEKLLFADFLDQWLKVAKSTIKLTTYSSYAGMLQNPIRPYFQEKGIALVDLQAKDIQDFYMLQLERVKPNTVIHYHAIIHRALKYAVRMDMLPVNPADKVDRPKKNEFKASFYNADEINRLCEVVKGTKLEIPVMLAAFYGLRRSEVVGLKWDCVDFDRNMISIQHTVTTARIDGKQTIVVSDTTKTKSSRRSLPLVPMFRERLLALRAEQEENRRLCGRSYCKEYLDYICVDEMGNRMNPSYITGTFGKLLAANEMRVIRFHDLRHSCASMMLASNVKMKDIQEWLGHSDFSTTANIYSHLDDKSKLTSAEAMQRGLGWT